MPLDKGEEVIGVVEPINEIKKGFTLGRNLCSNCNKGIHSTPNKANKSRCKGKDCECQCTTHYVGRNGKLIPFGVEDTTVIPDLDDGDYVRTEIDDKLDELNNAFKNKTSEITTETVNS